MSKYRLKHRRGANTRMARILASHGPTFEDRFPEEAAELRRLRAEADQAVWEITGGKTQPFPEPGAFRPLSRSEAAANPRADDAARQNGGGSAKYVDVKEQLREAILADRGRAAWEHGEALLNYYTNAAWRWARYGGGQSEWEAYQFSMRWQRWICAQFLRLVEEERAA